jgi:hypothetical protein
MSPSISGFNTTGFLSLGFIVVEELKQDIQLCISRITEKPLHRVA